MISCFQVGPESGVVSTMGRATAAGQGNLLPAEER
jgi:hypothetical protein